MLVHSTFLSLDGEVNKYGQGCPSFFIRLAGCNCSCSYCDIPEAQDEASGSKIHISELVNKVVRLGKPKVTITGGEPLLQAEELSELLWLFWKACEINVTIETNGTIDPEIMPNRHLPNISFIMDYKLDSQTRLDHFLALKETDWIKFVVQDREQYDEVTEILNLLSRCQARFALSPVHGKLDAGVLAAWMLEDHLWHANLNVQLHRIIGLP